MSITPKDLLSLAKRIVSAGESEVDFRNAMGRAYYAAYHEAKRFHDSLPSPGNAPPSKVGVHAELAFRLQRPTIQQSDPRFRTSQNVGWHMTWLHDKRINADYRLQQSIGQHDSAQTDARSERVFELCQ